MPRALLNLIFSDLQMTFLEFFEALIGCAEIFATDAVVKDPTTPRPSTVMTQEPSVYSMPASPSRMTSQVSCLWLLACSLTPSVPSKSLTPTVTSNSLTPTVTSCSLTPTVTSNYLTPTVTSILRHPLLHQTL